VLIGDELLVGDVAGGVGGGIERNVRIDRGLFVEDNGDLLARQPVEPSDRDCLSRHVVALVGKDRGYGIGLCPAEAEPAEAQGRRDRDGRVPRNAALEPD